MALTVYLHGGLRSCGGPYRVQADTAVKACRLIAAQVPGFDKALRSGAFRLRLGPMGKGGQTLRAGQERMLVGRHSEIHITPSGRMASGKKASIGKAVLGVALIGVGLGGGIAAGALGASAFGSSVTFGQIALFGASTALSGVASTLSQSAQVSRYENREAPEDRPNFLFNGGVNTIQEGPALAWVYGKDVFVGSNVISAGIINEQVGPGIPEPAVNGMVVDVTGSASASVLEKPKKSKFKAPEESPDTLQSNSIARILEAIGEGELELVDGLRSVYLDGTPAENADGSSNFPGYKLTWRSGTADQPSIPGLPEIASLETIGIAVTNANPVTAVVTNANANAARVTLRWPNGLRHIDSSGDIRLISVQFKIEVQPNGGAYTEVHNVTLVGKAAPNHQADYRVDLPAGGNPWSIRVTRLSPPVNPSTTTNDFSFEALTTVIEARLSYPYTALAMSEIDAKAFGFDIPRRVFRVRRVDALIPSNYDPDTRAYDGFWDGTFKRGCSDNPAWAFRDLLTSKRFGAGDDILEEQVDDASLYAIAQYCDGLVPDGRGGTEPRYTFNGALSTREDAYQAFSALAASFRGMIYWGSGTVVATQDRPKDVTKLVTRANTIGGDIAYESQGLRARHSVVKVTWNDPAQQGKPAVAYETDPDLVALFGERQLDIYAWGCTSEGLAHRIARWALETEKSGEIAHWSAALDHADLMPGEIVAVADPVISGSTKLGGRVISTGAGTVTLDRTVTLADGQTYTITVPRPDGTLFESAITDPPGSYAAVTVADPLPVPAPVAGAVWVITGSDVEPRQFLVTANARAGKLQFDLTATLHDPDKFARVEQEIELPPRPTSLLPFSKPDAPANLTLVEYLRQAGPQVQSAVDFSWTAIGDTAIRTFETEFKMPGDDQFRPLGTSPAVVRTILDVVPGTWTFRVRSRSQIGVPSDWAELSQGLLAQQQALADVTQFRGAIGGQQLLLSWTPIADLRQPPYRIRYSPLIQGATWELAADEIAQAYGSQAQVPARAGTYLIKAQTAYAESANATLLVIEAVANNFNVLEEISEHPAWTGAKSRLTKSGATLVLAAGNLEGVYVAAPPFDLGGVFGFRISTTIAATATNPNNVMATWPTLAGLANLSGVSADDWSVRMQIRTTNDDPNGMPVWTEWADIVTGFYSARAIDRRLVVSAGAVVEVTISEWLTTIDMEDRFEGEEDVVSNAAGDTKVFDAPFKAIPRIHINGQDMATGDYFRVTAKSASQFTVRFFNAAGTGISRSYDWTAVGYGIVTGSSASAVPLQRRALLPSAAEPGARHWPRGWHAALTATLKAKN